VRERGDVDDHVRGREDVEDVEMVSRG